MSWEDFSSEFRVKWIDLKINSAKSSVEFWENKLLELKDKYKNSNNTYEWQHIRAIKKYLKAAKSDLLYWESKK